ncbi:AMP-binding protein [Amycolatopsis sp. NPDC059021]|uniref:AMP-binding protein n=1 Tax=Amycolatopsis sp. NPDC059021 TaxID=3346704 RepID=UPI0036726C98
MRPEPEWTAGPPCTAPDEGLHQTVARIAAAGPGATALISGARRVSYADLDRTADAWAAGLIAAGVVPGDLVPIVLPRGEELVTALLAVLKAGAAYALLDPAWPAGRLRDVGEQLGARLVIARDASPIAPVWVPPAGPACPPPDFRPVEVGADAPCCVFFTSGTTGRPKGVLTPHRATARLFQPGTFARFGPGTVVPLAAPVPWDAFSLELWSALLSGGTALIVGEPYLSGPVLRAGIAEHGVGTVWLTSSLFNMIVDEDVAAFGGLRQVLIGGERLSTAHVGRFLRAHPGITLLNGYGPVENVVFATTHPITAADCDRPGGIPLGRPVPGTRVHVLDGTRPCEAGETGEICLSGDGLALRYLGPAALTDERFTELPLGDRTVRVYRTGDLGWWDDDGLLHFGGRADRQVKIRGHRIEPAEVERQIERLLPGVRSCVVLARTDQDGAAAQLVAFCVPVEPGDPLPGSMAALRQGLLPHHRPASVLSIESVPVTAQGKLDERALLAMAGGPRNLALPAAGARPADETTRVVVQVFAEVLGVPAVPADVPFAELGGGSLDAGRVCGRLAARLGRAVPISRLYRHSTAEALAEWLRGTRPAVAPDSAAGPGEVPLSPMQLVYLTKHLVDPADRTGHCLLTWIVEGELDREALTAAIETVHRRHEPLRAAYVADPSPVARLLDIEAPPLEVLPAEPAVEAAIRALRTLFAEELDPGSGDVWRAALVPVAESGTTVFGCVVHHIAFDGWSESVFAGDLAAAYNGVPPAAAPPSLAAARDDYVERLGAADLAAQREYLRAEFADVPDLRWPAGVTTSGATGPGLVEATVPAEVLGRVDARAKDAGTGRFAVLLADWAASLAEVTEQDDFAVGVPVAQRHGPGIEHAVGCHLTMLCVRLRGGALDPVTGAAETGRLFARAFEAQDVPVAEVLRPAGTTGRPPLFQTLFALQDNAIPHLPLEGLRTSFHRQPYLDLPLELHAELWPRAEGGLLLTVYFRQEAVAEIVAEDLVKRFTDRLHTRVPGVAG